MAKQSREDKVQEFNSRIASLSKRCTMPSVNSLTKPVHVPQQLGMLQAALLTGRPELAHAETPIDLNKSEAKQLFDLIGALLETNQALQEHSRETAQLVNYWTHQIGGVQAAAQKVDQFANFRPVSAEDEPEAPAPDDGPYLIWSNEHNKWWGPDGVGYVPLPRQAGRYTRARVLEIVKSASYGSPHNGALNELPVREADLRDAFKDAVQLANSTL